MKNYTKGETKKSKLNNFIISFFLLFLFSCGSDGDISKNGSSQPLIQAVIDLPEGIPIKYEYTLNSSGSTGVPPLSYEWTIIEDACMDTPSDLSTDIANPTFLTTDNIGYPCEFSLVVTDDEGNVDETTGFTITTVAMVVNPGGEDENGISDNPGGVDGYYFIMPILAEIAGHDDEHLHSINGGGHLHSIPHVEGQEHYTFLLDATDSTGDGPLTFAWTIVDYTCYADSSVDGFLEEVIDSSEDVISGQVFSHITDIIGTDPCKYSLVVTDVNGNSSEPLLAWVYLVV